MITQIKVINISNTSQVAIFFRVCVCVCVCVCVGDVCGLLSQQILSKQYIVVNHSH
jgi:hypothetical protein